jgi:hypothetical protein
VNQNETTLYRQDVTFYGLELYRQDVTSLVNKTGKIQLKDQNKNQLDLK